MLLSTNPKLLKSKSVGYISFGIHFAPHKLSGYNVCTSASKGCSNACLNGSGFGVYPKVQSARIKKTKLFYEHRPQFMGTLITEVETMVRRAKKNKLIPTFRLNLTSDVAWEKIKFDGKTILEYFPDVQFYDYTKDFRRMMTYLTGEFPKNYHLTFSRSESNDSSVKIVLRCGGNVAVVFKNKIPKTHLKKRVISGMEDDLRFLDKKGVVIGLLAKGKIGKTDTSGFVIGK